MFAPLAPFAACLVPILCLLLGSAQAQAQTPPQRPRKTLVVDLAKQSLLSFPPGKTQVEVPLKRGGNLLFAAVAINGQDAGVFLVDTGASTTLVDLELADRLKLPVVGKGATSGVGGRQTARAVSVEGMSLGPADAPAVLGKHMALAVDLAVWRKSFGPSFGGLLGATLWGAQPFTIDYRAQRLTFHQRAAIAAPAGARTIKLEFHHGHPAVAGRINDKFSSLVELDTGHESSLDLDQEFVRAHPELFDRRVSLPGAAGGIGGTAERWTTNLTSLEVFETRLTNLPASFGRSELAIRVEPDVIEPLGATNSLGLLGGGEMRNFRLTFDYLSAKMFVLPQPDDPLLSSDGKPADPNAADFRGFTPLATAVRNRDPQTVQRLLEAGAKPDLPSGGATPLALAVALDQPQIVSLLLAKGASVEQPLAAAQTALHAAAQLGHVAVIEKLLSGGAMPTARAKGGVTPLMLAALFGRRAAVELLAEKSPVNATDDAGQSALHYAVEGGRADVVAELLSRQADPLLRTRSGATPLDMARKQEKADLVKLLSPKVP